MLVRKERFMKKEDIIKISNEHNGYLYSDIIKKYSIDTIYISRLVKKGMLSKVARGIYITDSGLEDYYFINSILYSKIVFSGESALYLNNLSNKQYVNNEVTIPYGSSSPKIKHCKVVVSRKSDFSIGIIELNSPFGNKVRSYDKERCICDLFIRPDFYDYEDRVYAINTYKKNYLNFKKLYEYAKIFNVYNEVKNVFEVIGWN
jgi:predicted transcriptional regulator of viral defense system